MGDKMQMVTWVTLGTESPDAAVKKYCQTPLCFEKKKPSACNVVRLTMISSVVASMEGYDHAQSIVPDLSFSMIAIAVYRIKINQTNIS
jgi:hypothetical protein